MNNENHDKNLEKPFFDFRKVEKESEEHEAIELAEAEKADKNKEKKEKLEELLQKAREMWKLSDEFVSALQKVIEGTVKLDDAEKEIVRLEAKREKVARTLKLSDDAPALEWLQAQIARLKAGWKKEEK